MIYSRTPLVRPPLLHQKCGLSRGVASCQGRKSIHFCLDLYCQVAFPEGLASRQGGLSKGVPLYHHCLVVTDSRHALEVLERIQEKLLATDDRNHEDEIAALICMLDSPLFNQLVNVQDSVQKLKHAQESAVISPDQFDFTPAGEMVVLSLDKLFQVGHSLRNQGSQGRKVRVKVGRGGSQGKMTSVCSCVRKC